MAHQFRSTGPLRLKIEPVVGVAEALAVRVRSELPTHDGLAMAAGGVADCGPPGRTRFALDEKPVQPAPAARAVSRRGANLPGGLDLLAVLLRRHADHRHARSRRHSSFATLQGRQRLNFRPLDRARLARGH